jgi:FtsP/CotA-like multicopper oxidase with cupredoxin domain
MELSIVLITDHRARWCWPKLDTVSVEYGGTLDVVMDFTEPAVKGISAFHCHLSNHEEKEMMARACSNE